MYHIFLNQSFAILDGWTLCPFYVANLGLIVAGTISTGGLAGLAVKMSRNKNQPETIPHTNERSDENVDTHSG
jgi:hypothetical protein